MHGGDEKAAFYYEAMCYQIAKEIGRISTVFCGIVDQIVLNRRAGLFQGTGGRVSGRGWSL
jgi:butyrate kinase